MNQRNMLLLDLFCGAGGAARGYQDAGFVVVGVDHKKQKNYPGIFVQGDALRPPFELSAFDVIHASPPCQAYARTTPWRGDRARHPDLIDRVRELVQTSGRLYVLETVDGGRRKLQMPWMLCGTMFGLRVRRHRYFEIAGGEQPIPLSLGLECKHSADDHAFDHGLKQPESAYRDAMGCLWMSVYESRQAIPPAYTRWLGQRLLETLKKTKEKG